MAQLSYHPWLFDSYEAWSRATSDPRCRYDLPITSFMSIYAEYRRISTPGFVTTPIPAFVSTPHVDPFLGMSTPSTNTTNSSNSESVSPKEASQILNQNEIDSLLNGLLS